MRTNNYSIYVLGYNTVVYIAPFIVDPNGGDLIIISLAQLGFIN